MKINAIGLGLVFWLLVAAPIAAGDDAVPFGDDDAVQCGRLSEAQLYNERPVTAIDEYPWIGRVYHRPIKGKCKTKVRIFRCVAALISRRHLLTAVNCMDYAQHRPEFVLLGDFDYSNADTEPDCYPQDHCAPAPQEYAISDYMSHPRYNAVTNTNDIALIQLADDVQFNRYVQPICMPPPETHNADLLAQYFPVAGFLHHQRQAYLMNGTFVTYTNATSRRTKTVAHVISNERCSQVFAESFTTRFQIERGVVCVSYFDEYIFMTGSILMAVRIVNAQLSSVYLLGILNYSITSVDEDVNTQLMVFTKMSAHANWISSNMKQSVMRFKWT